MIQKEDPHALLVRMQIDASTMENSEEVPQKQTKKKNPLHDPEIPLLSICSKKHKALIQKNICTLMFIAALFTIAKIWKQPKYPSIDEWIKKQRLHKMEYFSAIKKNEILPFVTAWMDLEGIMLSEISQTEKGRYHMITFICSIIRTM